MPLSRDTGAIDGFEPFLAVIDEYHAAKTNEMIELIESGQGNLLQSLIFIISTAGFNLNSPLYTEELPYSLDILNGKHILYCGGIKLEYRPCQSGAKAWK